VLDLNAKRVMTTSGYDAAQTQRDHDDLERWQFAAEIVEAILATSNEWSARIGIFGKWGEGKTTVLRFAKEMLSQEHNWHSIEGYAFTAAKKGPPLTKVQYKRRCISQVINHRTPLPWTPASTVPHISQMVSCHNR
jgi:hypothetical protein